MLFRNPYTRPVFHLLRVPTFQYDWKDIFRFAWIEPAQPDDSDGPQTHKES